VIIKHRAGKAVTLYVTSTPTVIKPEGTELPDALAKIVLQEKNRAGETVFVAVTPTKKK
jgi:hypothetical protein